MMLGCALVSVLTGLVTAVFVWFEAGLLWAFLAYAAAGSIALLGAAFFRQAAPVPHAAVQLRRL